ncbi:MAG: DUF5519 family protein [Solirubrobacterales bacterium]|nr:DUF5519 family protein [Solirubrobacterales bacterium]MBV9915318.1 DUF5519 family protein [Solirubrobacterales bacterium]
MTQTHSPSQRITAEVTAWPGVRSSPGRRGEYSFRIGRREIGHLHGDRAAHFSFPKPLWRDLFEAGRITHHPVFPGREGMGARRITSDADVRDVISLMRLNYERMLARASGIDETDDAGVETGAAASSR